MQSLEKQALDLIRRDNLLHAGRPVIVGVSGGPDSICLIHVLAALAPIVQAEPVAMYIDHLLRPAETDAEYRYVRQTAASLGIAFESRRVDTREYAKMHKLSLEHAARDLRYDRLRQAAAAVGAQAIATAHTADDQAEEVLLRLLRGAGRKGLAGMTTRGRDIIRPLLQTGKKSILEYLAALNIPFCRDSMNSDMRYLRNRVRHKLLPYLEEQFDMGIRRALCKTADSLAEDENLLEELTGKAVDRIVESMPTDSADPDDRLIIHRQALSNLPQALQRRAIERLLWMIGSRASYDHILAVLDGAARGRPGTELHLSRGLRVGIKKDFLEFLYPNGQSAWRGRLYRK